MRRKPPRVLLVEDNSADVRLFQEALQECSAEVDLYVIGDGEDAIRYVRRQGDYATAPVPQLIILDLNLPRKDGLDVLEELKGDPYLRRIPVVVLTTSDTETNVLKAYDLHANCYIRKPIDLDNFIRAVQACEVFWLEVARLPGL